MSAGLIAGIVLIVVAIVGIVVGVIVAAATSSPSPTVTETPSQDVSLLHEVMNRIKLDAEGYAQLLVRAGPDWTTYSDHHTYEYDAGILRNKRAPGYRLGYTVHEGVLMKDGRELLSGNLQRVIGIIDGDAVVLCDDKVIYEDGRVIVDRVEPIDAYVSGSHLVVLTPSNVHWYKDGSEVGLLVTRGASLCEVKADKCVVGIPQEERFIVCQPGEIIESVSIPGTLGYTQFGYAVDYWKGLLAVGAPFEDAGRVYLFSDKLGMFLSEDVIHPVALEHSRFGHQVMLSKHGKVIIAADTDGSGHIDVVPLSKNLL